MVKKIYPRGSEWRKWDLHFHTPSSYDYGNNAVTNEELIEVLKKNEISAVAVTDHHLVDINRIRSLKEIAGSDIVIFPGIELCTDSRGSEPIHIIGIFPEDSDLDFLSQELNAKLEIASQKKSGKGDNQIYCDLKTSTGVIKGLGGIVTIHAGSKSNSLETITNTLPTKMAQKEDIADCVGVFELGQEKDAEAYIKIVFPIIGYRPMIVCSDNHNAHSYTTKQNCWIKADPTFQGLKQILYEPEGRVRIQELKPEEKPLYDLIDRVEYIGTENQKIVVSFSEGMNSVIGSRATGKSNLLKNIAYAVDYEQCNQKAINSTEFLQLKNFQVFWKDGAVNTLNTNDEKTKGLLFIPQRYLGDLVYEDSQNLGEFLINLFENRNDFAQQLQEYRKFEVENSLEIASLIKNLLSIREKGRNEKQILKKLGQKESLKTDIKNLEIRLKIAGDASGKISRQELDQYKQLITEISVKENQSKIIESNSISLSLLKNEAVITAEKVSEYDFSPEFLQKIEAKLKDSDEAFKKGFISQEITALKELQRLLNIEISKLRELLLPLRKKIEEHKALLQLAESLQARKDALQSVNTITNELMILSSDYETSRNNLIGLYWGYNARYDGLLSKVDNFDFSKVKVTTNFDIKSFREFISENINYHNSKAVRENNSKYKEINDLLKNPEEWNYDAVIFPNLLKQLLMGVLSGDLRIIAGKDEETVITELFRNRFIIDFLQSIENKSGNNFHSMSDGEKMLVLLEFIFKFDNYNYPVLLDQPEDDLDAKTISKEIVNFLKGEKIGRQVIIVSHNANLVILGDSEEVLIANKTGGSKPFFNYLSGSIENDQIKKEVVEILEGGAEALERRKQRLASQ